MKGDVTVTRFTGTLTSAVCPLLQYMCTYVRTYCQTQYRHTRYQRGNVYTTSPPL